MSSQSRTWRANCGFANSLTKMAISDPTGSAITVAIATSMAVPTIAGAIPPPVSPNTASPLVKKFQFSASSARRKTDHDEDHEHRDGGQRRERGEDLGGAVDPEPAARPAARLQHDRGRRGGGAEGTATSLIPCAGRSGGR